MLEVPEPPEKSRKRQIAEKFGEVVIASVPYAGGGLAVIYTEVLGAKFRKRQQEWARQVTEALADLSSRIEGLTPESLAKNEEFLDVLAQASEDAAKTGQEAKREALRNAVLNAALASDVDADQQALLLRHLRDFTPTHLRLLRLLSDPPAWYDQAGISWPAGYTGSLTGSLTGLVDLGIPELANRRDMADQLMGDLARAGLTNTSGLGGMMTVEGLKAKRTTPAGDAFLRFITDPRSESSGDEQSDAPN